MSFKREPKLQYKKERAVNPITNSGLMTRPEEKDPATMLDAAYSNLRFARPSMESGAVDAADPQQAADRVFLNLAGVKNKADVLLDAIEKNVRRNFIPVYADSEEIRKAVKHLDSQNSPDGSRIYWDLYRRAVFNAFHQFDGITMDVLDNLTGEPFADAKIIENNIQLWNNPDISGVSLDSATRPSSSRSQQLQQMLRERIASDGPSILERLLVYGGSLAFVWFLQKKLNIYDAQDKAEMAAAAGGGLTAGAVALVMIKQILIGIAVHMLIQGLLREDIERIMNDTSYPPEANVNISEIIGQAESLINGGTVQGHTLETFPGMNVSSRFLTLALSRLNEGGLELILNYATQWLATHNETGYDEWIVYMNLYDVSGDIENMLEIAPNYSPVFLEQARKAGKKKIGVPAMKKGEEHYASPSMSRLPSIPVMSNPGATYSSASSFAHLTHSDSWNDYRKDMIGTIQKDLLDSLQFAACSYNHAVNGFGAVLINNPFVPDMLCCFVRFTGTVDPRILQAIRSMVALFANGINFDLGGWLAKLHQRTYGDLMQKMSYELLALLDEVFNAIMDAILDFANSIDERLMLCLPIGAMMNMLLAGIEDLKNEFKDLLLALIDGVKTRAFNFDKKISIMTERQWARDLLSILDAIIAALQMGKLCNTSERELSHSADQLVNDYLKIQDQPSGLYKSLQDVINPTQDGNTPAGNIPGLPQQTEAGVSTSVKDNVRSNPLTKVNVYGVPLDIDKTIVGANQFNTFEGAKTLTTENGIDLPPFHAIINKRTTWSRTVSADQREKCYDKLTGAELEKFMQMASGLKGL